MKTFRDIKSRVGDYSSLNQCLYFKTKTTLNRAVNVKKSNHVWIFIYLFFLHDD